MAEQTPEQTAAGEAASKAGTAQPSGAAPETPGGNGAATPDASTLREALNAANTANEANVAALLQSARDANPNIPPDLIDGDTAEAIAASVSAGTATVQAVIAANPPASPQPAGGGAGAPPRPTGPPTAPEGVRGLARIQHALNNPGPGNTQPPSQ